MTFNDWLKQAEALERKCREIADKLFDKKRFEVRHIMVSSNGDCIVDFKDRFFEPNMDCEYYCNLAYPEDEESYEECIEECRRSLDMLSVSSIRFDSNTMEVKEATIATNCYGLGIDEPEDEDEKEAKEELKKRFAKAGCLVDPDDFDYIHPHEIAIIRRSRMIHYAIEEYPAICYIHPTHLNSEKCRIDRLVRVL